MISRFKLLICIAMLSACKLSFAQLQISGFAPIITAGLSGSTLNYSTLDYLTNTVKTGSFANVANFKTADGVLAWKYTNGALTAIVYDVTVSNWKIVTLNSNTGISYENSNGMVTWRSGSGVTGAAMYDPTLTQWKIGNLATASNTISRSSNTVAWTVQYAATCAVYDPVLGDWQRKALTAATNRVVLDGDMAAGLGSFTGWTAAIYDRKLHTWVERSSTAIVGYLEVGDGVIAWTDEQDAVHAEAYDIDLGIWVDSTFATNSTQTQIGLNSGTIYFRDNNGIQHLGYDSQSKKWILGSYTTAHCENLTWVPSPNPKKLVYFTCNSIGGQAHRYGPGDGVVVNGNNVFKAYLQGGDYVVRLFLDNLIANSYCDKTVMIEGAVGQPELRENWFKIAPNPVAASGEMRIEAAAPIHKIRIYNGCGQLLLEQSGHGNLGEISLTPLHLAAGFYLVEVEMTRGQLLRRKIVVQ